MNPTTVEVYALSLVILFAKFVGLITVQAKERLGQRRFRYAEDAAFWGGVVGEDSERCTRAQQVLRNDAESQLLYIALAFAYTALGLWPTGAPYYFMGYALSRVMHAHFLLTGRQPHRNRAFALGIGILCVLATHVAYAGIVRQLNW
jgi:hypothetical protein